MKKLKVKIKKLHENAVIPFYATEGSMCMDLTAVSYEFDEYKNCHIYHTGLAFEIPKGYGMFAVPRSSHRKTEVHMPNTPGVIDYDYRGEVLICFKDVETTFIKNMIRILAEALVENTTNDPILEYNGSVVVRDIENAKSNKPPYKVGDRVAQICILPYPTIEFEEVEELSKTDRGEGCYGHTGN